MSYNDSSNNNDQGNSSQSNNNSNVVRDDTIDRERSTAENAENLSQYNQRVEEERTTTRVRKETGRGNGNGGNKGGNGSEEEQQGNNNNNGGGGNNNNSKDASYKELLEAIQRLSTRNKDLELQLQAAKADNEAYKSLNEQFNTRLAKLEEDLLIKQQAARLEGIKNFVESSPAYKLLTPQERQAQIDNFAKGSMSLDEIKRIIEPLNASVQKVSYGTARSASYPPRLSLGGASSPSANRTIETRAASANPSTSVTAGSAADGSAAVTGSAAESDIPYFLSLPSAMFKKGGADL